MRQGHGVVAAEEQRHDPRLDYLGDVALDHLVAPLDVPGDDGHVPGPRAPVHTG